MGWPAVGLAESMFVYINPYKNVSCSTYTIKMVIGDNNRMVCCSVIFGNISLHIPMKTIQRHIKKSNPKACE